MIHTFTNDDGIKVIPFGSAQIEVKNGFWTFNGKQVRKGDIALQMFVSRFIVGCRLAFPLREHKLVPSHSVLATQETKYSSGHLRVHNYIFPPTRDEIAAKELARKEKSIGVSYLPEMEIFPEFIPKTN
jgi:hypothetical protein